MDLIFQMKCKLNLMKWVGFKMKELLIASKEIKYNSLTGEITRIGRKNSNGSFDKDGYLILKIKGVQYKGHRLAWANYYGKEPLKGIDHINRNKSDNRIVNLRDVSQGTNVRNTKKVPNKDTGVRGVYIDKTKGLVAKYAVRYKKKIYRFRDLSDAISFREEKRLFI